MSCFHYLILGTIFEPDEIDKKESSYNNQVARDHKNHKRFTGAFTGGFSAGYFNTVGSKEGWTPTQYVSSKSNRQKIKQVNYLDLMDEDDIHESGQQIMKKNENSSHVDLGISDISSGRNIISNMLSKITDKEKITVLYGVKDNIQFCSGKEGLGKTNPIGVIEDQTIRYIKPENKSKNRIYVNQQDDEDSTLLGKKNFQNKDFTDDIEDDDNLIYFGNGGNKKIEYTFFENVNNNNSEAKTQSKNSNNNFLKKNKNLDLIKDFDSGEILPMKIDYEFKEQIPSDFDYYFRPGGKPIIRDIEKKKSSKEVIYRKITE